MSAQTRADLEAAMYAHINDEEGAPHIVTGWVLSAATSAYDGEDRGEHTYWFDTADHQAPHITRGLVAMVADWDPDDDD